MEPLDSTKLEILFKEHLVADTKRLDRIEVKIDQLAETVVAIARAEEKLVNLERIKQQLRTEVNEQEVRITSLEQRTSSAESTIRLLHKLFWVIVPIGAALVFDVVYFGGGS